MMIVDSKCLDLEAHLLSPTGTSSPSPGRPRCACGTPERVMTSRSVAARGRPPAETLDLEAAGVSLDGSKYRVW
jgi:hypothetical protein